MGDSLGSLGRFQSGIRWRGWTGPVVRVRWE